MSVIHKNFLQARSAIGLKFGLSVMAAAAVILTASVLVVMQNIAAHDLAQAEKAARTTAERLTGAVDRVFRDAFAIIEDTHDDLVELRAAGIDDPVVYDTLVRRIVTQDARFGAWLEWDGPTAPGAAVSARRDAHGRFTTYLHQNGMEMLRESVPDAIYESDLFKVPRFEARAFLLAPHKIDARDGDSTLVTSFAQPLMVNDQVSGVLAVDIKLDAIDDAIGTLDLPKGTLLAVVSENGMIGAASDKAWIGKPIDLANRKLAVLLERAKRGDGTILDPSRTAPSLQAWSAIRFGAVKHPWFLLMQVPQVSLLATRTNEHIPLFVVAGVALLLLLLAVMLAMHHFVVGPMAKLGATIDELGQGAFAIDVPGQKRSDEIGVMARAIARFQDSQMMIARLHEENGEHAYQRLIEREAATESLLQRFSQSVEAVAVSLKTVAATIGIQSHDLAASISSASSRLHDLAATSAITRTDMTTAASSTTSLIHSIEAIGDRLQHGRAAAEIVRQNSLATDSSLADLQRAVHEVGSMVALIQTIAERVNLIALNATIEAARAGQAGRGFAVVAQEVKTLAMQTSMVTEQVVANVQAIEVAASSTALRINDMRAAFDLHQTNTREITDHLDHQSRTTGSLLSLIDKAVDGAGEAADAASTATTRANEVAGSSEVMRRQGVILNDHITVLMEEVAAFVITLKAA